MIWKSAIARLLENRIKQIAVIASLSIGIAMFGACPVYAQEMLTDSEYFNATVKDNSLYQEKFDTSNLTKVDDGCYFNRESGLYYISVPGYSIDSIISNVMDGMYVQSEVNISVADGIRYAMYKDGEQLSNYNGEPLVEPGSYSLVVENAQSSSNSTLSFNIIGEYTNTEKITFPSNCYITSVTMNGDNMRYSSSYLEFTTEGTYDVKYEMNGVDKEYEIVVTVDTTAPTLSLDGIDEKNKARGPVDITEVSKDASVDIILDEVEIDYTTHLTAPGEYQIVLEDKAGNQNVYSFTILLYINGNSILFILMFIALIAGVVGYIVYIRKHLRVR